MLEYQISMVAAAVAAAAAVNDGNKHSLKCIKLKTTNKFKFELIIICDAGKEAKHEMILFIHCSYLKNVERRKVKSIQFAGQMARFTIFHLPCAPVLGIVCFFVDAFQVIPVIPH